MQSALVALTAERKAGAPSSARRGPPLRAPRRGRGESLQGIPGVEAIIAVASGKGGVGKSTTAVNLALGLSALGTQGRDSRCRYLRAIHAKASRHQGAAANVGGTRLKPITRYGLTVMSIGFLIDEETPMIWRGPMVISALTQMLREVEWGPSTSWSWTCRREPATPSSPWRSRCRSRAPSSSRRRRIWRSIDARRGISMFRRVNVPVLGIVENMSYFLCPQCGTRSDIFGHGGARHESERQGVPFLGEVPLHMSIREKSDAGLPVVATEPDGPHAATYRASLRRCATSSAGRRARCAQDRDRGLI